MNILQKLTFVLAAQEEKTIVSFARGDSLSQASVLRRLIRQAAKSRGLWMPNQEAENQQDLAFEEGDA